MNDNTIRICNQCGEEKPLNKESFELADGKHFRKTCRSCNNKRARERRKNRQGIHKYKCKYCNEDYTAKEKNRDTFCSRECSYEYMKEVGVSKQCESCGGDFTAHAHAKRYCSEGCAPVSEHEHVSRLVYNECPVCNSMYKGYENSPACSGLCKDIVYKERKRQAEVANHKGQSKSYECVICSSLFTPLYGNRSIRVCGNSCRVVRDRDAKSESNARRRARLRGNGRHDYGISLTKLIAKHYNECAICGEPCDRKDFIHNDEGYHVTGPNYPSVDHIIPISKGGTHTRENIQLAHHLCNSIKSNEEDVCYEEVSMKKDLLLS